MSAHKLENIRLQIKEDLCKSLVAKKLFEERFTGFQKEINLKFKNVDSKINNLQNEKNLRFETSKIKLNSLQKEMSEKFKSVDIKFKSQDFKLNFLIGLTITAFTFANPAFIKLIEKLF